MYILRTLLVLLLSASSLFGQIKFTSGTFDNGMAYPIAHFSTKPEIADTMNHIISEHLIDAQTSDFCIGDYGYFHKGNHIELHLVCNCIDFDETDHQYLFFSLETGQLVDYSDLFEEKRKADAMKTINREVRAKKDQNECTQGFGDMTDNLNWSDIKMRLYKDGIEIHPAGIICEKPVQIPWTALSEYLRYNFL